MAYKSEKIKHISNPTKIKETDVLVCFKIEIRSDDQKCQNAKKEICDFFRLAESGQIDVDIYEDGDTYKGYLNSEIKALTIDDNKTIEGRVSYNEQMFSERIMTLTDAFEKIDENSNCRVQIIYCSCNEMWFETYGDVEVDASDELDYDGLAPLNTVVCEIGYSGDSKSKWMNLLDCQESEITKEMDRLGIKLLEELYPQGILIPDVEDYFGNSLHELIIDAQMYFHNNFLEKYESYIEYIGSRKEGNTYYAVFELNFGNDADSFTYSDCRCAQGYMEEPWGMENPDLFNVFPKGCNDFGEPCCVIANVAEYGIVKIWFDGGRLTDMEVTNLY